MSIESFITYQQSKDIKTRNLIVKLHLNLARSIAHKKHNTCHEPYEDLEQEATLGLIKAVERFDPNKGVAFSSFATPYINGAILQYLRDKGHAIRLPQSQQTLEHKGRKLAGQLTEKLGKTPTASEIAAELGVSEEKYLEAVEAVNNSRNLISLSSVINPGISKEEESMLIA